MLLHRADWYLQILGLFLSFHLGHSGNTGVVHFILVMMENFCPRISFFTSLGNQNVLFYPSKQFTTCLFLMLRKCFPTQRLSLYYTLPLGDTAFFEDHQGSKVHFYICSCEKTKSHTFL